MKEQLEESPRVSVTVRATPPAAVAPRPVAATPPPTPQRRPSDDDEDEEGGFFARNWIKILVGVTLVGAGVGAFVLKSGDTQPVRKAPERMISIQIPPAPPPPPPPPPPKVEPPPPEQKMIEQVPVEQEEKPPEAPKPKDEPPPVALGTNIKGPGGSDGFGLGTSGNGGGLGLGQGGGGGRQGSKWGWYAGQVQSKVAEALRQHRQTRSAALRVDVRIWADLTGRITRAQLVGSSGDAALDRTLQGEVLTGLRLAEPPPEGMPMPIVLRLSARRPN